MGEKIDRREEEVKFFIHLTALFSAIYILHAFLVSEISHRSVFLLRLNWILSRLKMVLQLFFFLLSFDCSYDWRWQRNSGIIPRFCEIIPFFAEQRKTFSCKSEEN